MARHIIVKACPVGLFEAFDDSCNIESDTKTTTDDDGYAKQEQ